MNRHLPEKPAIRSLSIAVRGGLAICLLASIAGAQFGRPLTLPGRDAPSQVPAASQDRVQVQVVPHLEPAPAGEPFALAIVLDVVQGWHLYANPTGGEFGLPTVITARTEQDVTFGQPQYPRGEFYRDESLGAENYIYEGRAVIYLPVLIPAGTAFDAATVEIELDGQLCSDAGQCVLWSDQASVELPIAVAGQEPVTRQPELFADYRSVSPAELTGDQAQAPAQEPGFSLVLVLLGAFAAGLLLDVMPCVWPVIPIIIGTLARHVSGADAGPTQRSRTLAGGLAFAAGILVVFAGLAIVMGAFNLFWGQQFQSTWFKFALLTVVLVLSLSMLGLYEIVLPPRLMNVQVARGGYLGAFGMGMLATVLATPCGAPLLGSVVGAALTQPMPVTVGIFLLMGVGMAAPFVLLTAFPSLLGRVPRAGKWMNWIKQGLGFLLLAFAVYLASLFPATWHRWILTWCVLVAMCVWLAFYVAGPGLSQRARRIVRLVALALLVAGSIALGLILQNAPAEGASSGDAATYARIEQLRQEQVPFVVKFTADWCTNCKVVEQRVFQTDAFAEALERAGAELVVADLTASSPRLNELLTELGGPGQALPFAAVFPRGPGEPITLEALYTLDDMLEALERQSRGQDT